MIYWLRNTLYWLKMAYRAVRNTLYWLKMSYRAVRNQIQPQIEKINDKLEKLEESVTGTDECVVDIYALEEKT